MGSVELRQSHRQHKSPDWGYSGLPRRYLSSRWPTCYTARSSKNSKNGPRWQEAMAQKLEDRRGYLSEKWKKTNLATGLSKGQQALLEGWRKTDISKSVDKDLEALQQRWRRAEREDLNEWQRSARSALTWTAIAGPVVSGLVLGIIGLTVTVVVGMTAIILFVPYAVVMGRTMDISLFYAAFQIALIQLFTVFSWTVYSAAEWTITRTMNEEEKRRYLEDQELNRMQIEELEEFDFRLDRGREKKDKF